MPDKITSRFGFSVIFSAVFITILTGFLGGLALYTLSLMVMSGKIAIVGSLFLIIYVGLWIVAVRYFIRESPRVTIDRRGIWYRTLFARSGFLWEDVAKINLLKTESHHFEQAEATTFKLRNGEKFVVWAEIYQNGAALRQAIDQAQQLLSAGKPIGPALQFEPQFSDISEKRLETPEKEIFTGSHFLSIRGICFYGLNLMAVYHLVTMQTKRELVGFLILHAFSWAFGHNLFYFEMTANHLVVRHHIFFWYEKNFPLKEIKQCVFYQKYRQANGMRVILKDFRTFNFPAGSLHESNWASLKKALKESDISLRVNV